MEKTKVNGTELEYEVTGTGEPVLLISTGPIRDSFFPLLNESVLAEDYSLIRYRQRPLDQITRQPVTFAEHAADAAGLLEHLGVRRAHVVGHSTGAVIALELAVNYPAMVQTLTLLEPPLFGVPSAGTFLENLGPAFESYAAGHRELALKQFLSYVCGLDWDTFRSVVEGRIPGEIERTLEHADNVFESYLPSLSSWQFGLDEAAKISQPVLSVVGSETNQLFAEGQDVLHSWFPQVEDCEIEGVAHLLHMQRPEPVASGIAGFLAQNPMRKPRTAIRRPRARV